MEPINKKTLEHKLHVQHSNTKQDAANVIIEYFAELEKENEIIKQKFTEPTFFNNDGSIKGIGTFNHYGYNNSKKNPDIEEITRRIKTLKQRKPKDGE